MQGKNAGTQNFNCALPHEHFRLLAMIAPQYMNMIAPVWALKHTGYQEIFDSQSCAADGAFSVCV